MSEEKNVRLYDSLKAKRLYSEARNLLTTAAAHELMARELRKKAFATVSADMIRLGIDVVEFDDGYKMSYVSMSKSSFDKQEMVKLLVAAGVKAKVVQDCMQKATKAGSVSEYLKGTSPKGEKEE